VLGGDLDLLDDLEGRAWRDPAVLVGRALREAFCDQLASFPKAAEREVFPA
jgi:hypothetical protein